MVPELYERMFGPAVTLMPKSPACCAVVPDAAADEVMEATFVAVDSVVGEGADGADELTTEDTMLLAEVFSGVPGRGATLAAAFCLLLRDMVDVAGGVDAIVCVEEPTNVPGIFDPVPLFKEAGMELSPRIEAVLPFVLLLCEAPSDGWTLAALRSLLGLIDCCGALHAFAFVCKTEVKIKVNVAVNVEAFMTLTALNNL